MATPLGILGTTGVGGLTLGGGIGHLSRRHGLTIDNLLGADVVLADGSKVTASADENPDLFWAIRGGGGNFGVVTEFRYRLHPVSTVVAGPTFWSLDDTVAVMQRYREFIPQAPRELNGFFAFATVPPVRAVPGGAPRPQGERRRVVLRRRRHRRGPGGDGPDARGRGAAHARRRPAAVRRAAGVLRSASTRRACRATGGRTSSASCPTRRSTAHAEHAERMAPGASTMHLYPIDGAVHDVGESDTAWSYRDVQWAEVIYGIDPDPASADADPRLDGRLLRRHPPVLGRRGLRQLHDGRGPGAGEGDVPLATTTGSRAIKSQYDPENTFRVNQNIQPGA